MRDAHGHAWLWYKGIMPSNIIPGHHNLPESRASPLAAGCSATRPRPSGVGRAATAPPGASTPASPAYNCTKFEVDDPALLVAAVLDAEAARRRAAPSLLLGFVSRAADARCDTFR